MELLSLAAEYLQRENEEFNSSPDSVGVSTIKHSDSADFEVSGQFPEESPEDSIVPKSKRVQVSRNSDLQSEIESVFGYVREHIQINGAAEIDTIHIGPTPSMNNFEPEWPFYTTESADARVFIGVSQDFVPTEIEELLSESVISQLRQLDNSIQKNNLKNVEYLFSDTEECLLQTVRGYVETVSPYKYFSNCSSTAEYVESIADSPDEYDALTKQELYEVYFRLADAESTPSDSVRHKGEHIMDQFIDESLETEWEYIVEAESICFGEFDNRLQDEIMKYYINVPISNGTIGESH